VIDLLIEENLRGGWESALSGSWFTL